MAAPQELGSETQAIQNQRAIITMMNSKLMRIEDRAKEALAIGSEKAMSDALHDIIKIKIEARTE